MVGVALRMNFDMLTPYQKEEIKELCKEYRVQPVCMHSGGEVDNMSFDFGDYIEKRDLFLNQMETIIDAKSNGTRRRVLGHKIECPL